MASVPGGGGFLDSLNGIFSNPNNAGLMGAAMGLLQSSGASRLPVTMGAALGNAAAQSQNYQRQAQGVQQAKLSNAMARLMLGYKGSVISLLDGTATAPDGQGEPSGQAAQADNGPGTANGAGVPSAQPSQILPSGVNKSNLLLSNLNPPAPQTSSAIPPSQSPPQAQSQGFPGAVSAQLGQYSPLARLALEMTLMQDPGKAFSTLAAIDPGIQKALAGARTSGAASWEPIPQNQVTQMFPGGLPPGVTAFRNSVTGEVKVGGQSPVKLGTGYNAAGFKQTVPFNIRTGLSGSAAVAPQATPSGQPNAQVVNQNATAALIAQGDAPIDANMVNTPAGQRVISEAQQINPKVSATTYPTVKAFTQGAQGDVIRHMNVAVQHLGVLGQLASALKSGNDRAINASRQAFQKQFGSPAPTSFNAAKQLIADEIQRAVSGGAGTEGDRAELMKSLSAANSPKQLGGVINTFDHLMYGQLQGLQKQYEAGSGLNNFQERFLTPQSRKLFTRITTISQAQQAIAAGASKAAVIKKLEALGITDSGIQ